MVGYRVEKQPSDLLKPAQSLSEYTHVSQVPISPHLGLWNTLTVYTSQQIGVPKLDPRLSVSFSTERNIQAETQEHIYNQTCTI